MITESGLLTPELHRSDSVQAAIDGGGGHKEVTWIAMQAPSLTELDQVFGALGLSGHTA
jgi:hypothetical protein